MYRSRCALPCNTAQLGTSAGVYTICQHVLFNLDVVEVLATYLRRRLSIRLATGSWTCIHLTLRAMPLSQEKSRSPKEENVFPVSTVHSNSKMYHFSLETRNRTPPIRLVDSNTTSCQSSALRLLRGGAWCTLPEYNQPSRATTPNVAAKVRMSICTAPVR